MNGFTTVEWVSITIAGAVIACLASMFGYLTGYNEAWRDVKRIIGKE